ncbi:hypothetical protein [uncultured Flavobacterium sp.]|uniref:hypothetical protein n=1 Tax=uncultured Flavobacterium sp. TaxID=165435 RepID=UPI0027E0A2F8|nr:hypothetical protein [uncultured Flavobacterium sp.]
MKNFKNLLICIFFIGNLTYAQKSFKNTFSRNLMQIELANLKLYLNKYTETNLDSVSMLSIHYIQPRKYCHYSKYVGNPKKVEEWFDNFYKEGNVVFPENSKIINSFYEEKGKEKYTPEYNYYYDENHFLHNLINKINKMESCECFITLNSKGKLMIKYGEVSTDEIKHFIKETAILDKP